ncbi:hypothetical protein ARMGADRAFT_1035930 [Armillaria gallica]|uniref:F-box domain-containing protein n=1 Tax=Armillaria gallica TaxID=47427 RepID=A0A2H3CSB8_ARMGA|nr:hypothetical protein ARMGADRAFT_1035930 [Armillaria gallica]
MLVEEDDDEKIKAIWTQADNQGACKYHVPPLPSYCSPKLMHEILPLPVEVLATILSLLSCMALPALALLSHNFLSAVQAMLYGDLNMWDIQNPDTLWIFLVTR